MDPVSHWAQRLLFGTSLADKLAPWPDVDVSPGPAIRVDLPSRPPELAFPTRRRTLPSIRPSDLDREGGRTRVLHELANHELQAMELLAMALLRWPDAPRAFRRGLVATLRDEQRHCRLYLDRLRASGGTVGEVPVSRFFWDTLGPVHRVEDFVAGLSLCFELANLDFCLAWRERFRAVGDTATATTLTAVYEDEIRHVAHGLVWFSRWNPGDRLDAWQARLPHPLTPARARGPRFDREGRRRAGFSEAECDRLRLVGGSRGRPPRVVWFDATLEDRLARGAPSAMSHAVTADLATVPMFLVGAEDVVVAPAPDPAFLARLADAGFAIPRFVSDLSDNALGPHPIATLEPWGPGPDDLPPDVSPLTPTPPWNPAWAALSRKTETARRAAALWDHPAAVAPLGAVWTDLGDPGPGPWVLKAPYSTSGTRRLRGHGPLTSAQRTWVQRTLDTWGEVLWQPWWDRVLDVSVHIHVGADVTIDGITRFATGPTGAFRGAWLGRWTRGVAPEIARFLHGDGDPSRAVEPLLRDAAHRAGAWARELGYVGPLSIDAAVVRTPKGLRVHPWLETNARRTLGRVALALRDHVATGHGAWWRVARRTSERAATLAQATPTVARGRLVHGLLPTTDPRAATTLLTWLDVTGL